MTADVFKTIDLLIRCLAYIHSMLLDLDRRIEDDKQQMQRENEKCDCFEEEMSLLEKQYGQNVHNIQR